MSAPRIYDRDLIAIALHDAVSARDAALRVGISPTQLWRLGHDAQDELGELYRAAAARGKVLRQRLTRKPARPRPIRESAASLALRKIREERAARGLSAGSLDDKEST